MRIFAIETSCDETATAIVDVPARRTLAQRVYSQLPEHAPYGGVVPEIASRAHLERLPELAAQTLAESGLSWADITAFAATTGPGLTTALVIGTTFAKTLALANGKPFLATNHIEGHALSPHFANTQLTFPYLLLLVTGGHTQLIMVEGVGRYTQLGTTLDDAVGECFDKVGKLLGLPHPAGPQVEKLAATGNPQGIKLPSPLHDTSLNFSFSGLKTAVKDLLTHNPQPITHNPSIASAFQTTVAQSLARKTGLALQQTAATQLVVAGGVAANAAIRSALQQVAAQHGATFTAPPLSLCTDNAVMIAYAAGLRHAAHLSTGGLGSAVRPRWPLEEMAV
ncbi:MAG: tRNA (adenosine(37)-N6)-threonylcarbamoyltransferase complex transferase subunit TsaD [Proteobacteria bacterium]|nr:tRNA (adenosine(37)-N6)-threonylcarbamoyltransferase complex transferase subunit TsaD [Pseudomonadota bacterium]